MLSTNKLYPICKSVSEITSESWFHILTLLNRTGELYSFLEMINMEELLPESGRRMFPKKGRILVIGGSAMKIDDIRGVFRRFRIPESRLEIIAEYSKNYNFRKLQNNTNYCAILVGPLPHKTTETGDESSSIIRIEKDDSYPPVFRLTNSDGKLHISKSNLEKVVRNLINEGLIAVGP